MIPASVRRGSSIALGLLASIAVVGGTLAAGDVRLSNDVGNGYVSAYALATGQAYTDAVLTRMFASPGRQNEPAVEINPRNPCPDRQLERLLRRLQPPGSQRRPTPAGPSGWATTAARTAARASSARSSRATPATRPPCRPSQIRTASSGDPVIAWDAHGRVFMGSERSDDPAGTKKTFGDVYVAVYDNPGGTGRLGAHEHATVGVPGDDRVTRAGGPDMGLGGVWRGVAR